MVPYGLGGQNHAKLDHERLEKDSQINEFRLFVILVEKFYLVSRLARARSNPHLLEIGFEKEEIRNGDWNPTLDISHSEEDLFKSKSSEDLSKLTV